MLIDYLKQVPDPRDPQGREYKLWEILLVSILAVLSGAKGYKDIERFAEARFEDLKKHFGIKWKRVPVYTAMLKVLVRLNPEDMEAVLRHYAKDLAEKEPSSEKVQILCFDGKSLNGSFSQMRNKRTSYIFKAFAPIERLVLGTQDIGDKENEIPHFQKMIEDMDLKGVYVTADAMHCQKKLLN